MLRHRYTIKEIHDTMQGEGTYTGSRIILVRFSGCNVWSGREDDRAKGRARCALWCDTDFRGGTEYTASELADQIKLLWGDCRLPPRVLFTGGEPALQYDGELYQVLKGFSGSGSGSGCLIHIETNGSIPLKAPVDWCTVSPKSPLPVVQRASEIKLVYPGDDPSSYRGLSDHLYLQPLAGDPEALNHCLAYIRRHPEWKLSLQTHKFIQLP